jgi:hypothetical protein
MFKEKDKAVAYSGDNHKKRDNSSPYGVSRLSPRVLLPDLGAQSTSAESAVVAASTSKLSVIFDQIEYLKAQAQRILDDAYFSLKLHKAKCNFSKKPGQTYYLYQKQNGDLQWSILSLEDWNGSPPWRYMGAFQLQGDQSWEDINDLEEIINLKVEE